MSANHSLSYPSSDCVYGQAAITGAQPWVGESEPMLPVRQVTWISLALLGVVLAVLLAV